VKYSGGTVLTLDHNSILKKNAADYLSDYAELGDLIEKGEYKIKDIELVVDLYNNWKGK
jgi:hypothetical protein